MGKRSRRHSHNKRPPSMDDTLYRPIRCASLVEGHVPSCYDNEPLSSRSTNSHTHLYTLTNSFLSPSTSINEQ